MTTGGDQSKPVSLFYSYSHKDEDLRRELETHLSVLRRNGMIAEWHDRKIEAGDDWKNEIDRHLTSADIVLLLVSADFIHSDYCWSEEMTKALERDGCGEAQVIPVILRHCRWQNTPLGRLQAVPRNAKPIRSWADRDEALDDVVGAIERAVDKVRRGGEEHAARKKEKETESPRQPAATPEPLPEAVSHKASKPSLLPAEEKPVATDHMPDLSVFRDIDEPWCPELVTLPTGAFMMGSRPTDEEADDAEQPWHQVTIGYRFAVGRYPVTFEEYDRFCEAAQRDKPRDSGWDRGRRPVINVNWDEAKAYVAWLGKETGKDFRLLSESEWEYACRGGTVTRYSCGDSITGKDAKFLGKGRETTEVGSYPANPWGLYDMHGNVWEWVEDIWHNNYIGAPTDAAAWVTGGGSGQRVLRGGSWLAGPHEVHSAGRSWSPIDVRDFSVGFRIARTL